MKLNYRHLVYYNKLNHWLNSITSIFYMRSSVMLCKFDDIQLIYSHNWNIYHSIINWKAYNKLN